MKKRLLAVLLVAAMTISLAACGGSSSSSDSDDSTSEEAAEESEDEDDDSGELIEVTVATPTTLESLDQIVPFIAEAMGYFEEEGLDVTIVDGTGTDTKMVSAGQADFCHPSPSTMMAAIEAGLDLIAVGNYCVVNCFGFAATTDSGITDWADIEGTTIALGDASWQQIAEPILTAAGVDLDTVSWEVIGDTRYQSVATGQCEVLLTWLGEYGQLIGQGYDFVYIDSNEVLPAVSNALTCTTEYAEENPEVVTKLTTAYMKAIYFMYCNPEAAGDIFLTACPSVELDKDELLSAIEYSIKTNMGVSEEDQAAYVESGMGLFEEELWQNAMEAALAAGSITEEIDVSTLYTNEYIDTSWDKTEVEEDAANYTEFQSEAFQ